MQLATGSWLLSTVWVQPVATQLLLELAPVVVQAKAPPVDATSPSVPPILLAVPQFVVVQLLPLLAAIGLQAETPVGPVVTVLQVVVV